MQGQPEPKTRLSWFRAQKGGILVRMNVFSNMHGLWNDRVLPTQIGDKGFDFGGQGIVSKGTFHNVNGMVRLVERLEFVRLVFLLERSIFFKSSRSSRILLTRQRFHLMLHGLHFFFLKPKRSKYRRFSEIPVAESSPLSHEEDH